MHNPAAVRLIQVTKSNDTYQVEYCQEGETRSSPQMPAKRGMEEVREWERPAFHIAVLDKINELFYTKNDTASI